MYLHRLGRWLQQIDAPPDPTPPAQPAPPGEPDEAPPELLETLDATKKLARAQSRQGIQLEELGHKLEGGFSEVRAQLAALLDTQRALASSPDSVQSWGPLLDALDALDAAALEAHALGSTSLHSGLVRTRERIEAFLSPLGLRRLASTLVGTAPDGRHVRVISLETRDDLPDGSIVRVVQAAVLAGTRVVREGSVVVAQRPTASEPARSEAPPREPTYE